MPSIHTPMVTLVALLVTLLAAPAGVEGTPDGDVHTRAFDSLKRGDLDEGVGLLEPWLEEHPDDADAWRLLGHLLFAQEKTDAARIAFGKALAGGRLEPDVFERLLVLETAAGREAVALDAAHLLVLSQPENVDARVALADAATRAGDRAEARAILEEIVDEHPERSDAWRRLGACHEALGADRAAVKCFRTAQVLGDATPLDERIAGALWRSGSPGRAARWYAKALESGGTDRKADLRLWHARALYASGDLEAAGKTWKEIESTGRPSASDADGTDAWREARWILGSLARGAGNDIAAEEYWRDLVGTDRESRGLLMFLARSKLEARAWGRGLDLLEHCRDRFGYDAELRRMMLRTLRELGLTDAHRRELVAYVAEHGLDPLARQELSRGDPRGRP